MMLALLGEITVSMCCLGDCAFVFSAALEGTLSHSHLLQSTKPWFHQQTLLVDFTFVLFLVFSVM